MSELRHEAARVAVAGLQKKIDAAVHAAWLDGKDFMHGPIKMTMPAPFDTTLDITRPMQHTIEVDGGPIERGRSDIPAGWIVYRCPDLSEGERVRLAAGRLDWRDQDWEDCCMVPSEYCPCGERS